MREISSRAFACFACFAVDSFPYHHALPLGWLCGLATIFLSDGRDHRTHAMHGVCLVKYSCPSKSSCQYLNDSTHLLSVISGHHLAGTCCGRKISLHDCGLEPICNRLLFLCPHSSALHHDLLVRVAQRRLGRRLTSSIRRAGEAVVTRKFIAAQSWMGYVETHSAGSFCCELVQYRPQVEPSGEPQDWYSIYFALPTPTPIRGYRRRSTLLGYG